MEAQGSLGLNTDTNRLFDSPTSATARQKSIIASGPLASQDCLLTEKFDIFARAGGHNTQVSGDINNFNMTNLDQTEKNYAVDAGAQFDFNQKSGVRAEYTYYGGFNGGTVSLGYVPKF